MNKPFYLLKGTIFRNSDTEENLIEVNEIFQNGSILEARKMAFSKLRSFIDVFLESVGKEYSSHKQAVEDLLAFIKSSKENYGLNNPVLGKLNADFDKGLFLYLVTDASDIYVSKERETVYNKKILVYSFSNEINEDIKIIRSGLKNEYKFYLDNNLFSNENEKQVSTSSIEGDLFDVDVIKGDYDILGNENSLDELMNSL